MTNDRYCKYCREKLASSRIVKCPACGGIQENPWYIIISSLTALLIGLILTYIMNYLAPYYIQFFYAMDIEWATFYDFCYTILHYTFAIIWVRWLLLAILIILTIYISIPKLDITWRVKRVITSAFIIIPLVLLFCSLMIFAQGTVTLSNLNQSFNAEIAFLSAQSGIYGGTADLVNKKLDFNRQILVIFFTANLMENRGELEKAAKWYSIGTELMQKRGMSDNSIYQEMHSGALRLAPALSDTTEVISQ